MRPENKNNVNGYILAGGKSSRMGTDKGLMLFNGRPVVQYIIDALLPVVSKVVIVSNNPAYSNFGYEVIEDRIKDIGPAGGIFSALEHSNKDHNFIIGCDMPFVTSTSIAFIIQNAIDAQITLPVHNGRMEPLFGVYSKSCLNEWKNLIEKDKIKLHEMVRYFDLKQLNVDSGEIFNASLFVNLNTREEFEKALKHTKNGD